MMEINLKDTLRNLRWAKSIAQEILADYFGIDEIMATAKLEYEYEPPR